MFIELNSLELSVNHEEGTVAMLEGCPPLIKSVVQQFDQVFASQISLPPKRARDHNIEIESGVGPLNVMPYHCLQFQKDQIEKLVQEMLLAGVVHPSKSAFSSPVLLVKKKTGVGDSVWIIEH